MASLDIYRFMAGAAGEYKRQDDLRADYERELKKTHLVEQLRRETSDYEFKREEGRRRKLTDTRQSYADGATGKYIMVNEYGEKIGERQLTETEKRAMALDDIKAERERIGLALDKKQLADYGRYGGGGGGGRGGAGRALDDSVSDRDPGKLNGMLIAMSKSLETYGVPSDMRAYFELEAKRKIASGEWDARRLRQYEVDFMSDPRVRVKIVEHRKRQERERAAREAAAAAKADP